MLKKIKIFALCAATLSLPLFFSCTSSNDSIRTDKSELLNSRIQMAVILPLSGKNAEAAADVLSGLKIGVETVNNSGGINGKQVELSILDSSNPEFAFVETFNSLYDRGIRHFHIGFTQETALKFDFMKEKEDCFFNFLCAYPPAVVSMKGNAVRIFLNGAQEADLMASKVDRSDGRVKHLIAMSVDDFYGKSCGDYLAFNLKLEKTKYYSDVFGQNEKDFGVFSLQISRLLGEYVFYTGYGKELPAFIKSLGDSKQTCTVIASCGFYLDNVIVPRGINFYRIETLFQQGKISNPEHSRFVNASKKYNLAPTWMSACGYDSAIYTARAAAEAGLNPKAMASWFKNKKLDGAMGTMIFDSAADSTSQIELIQKF